MIKKGKKPTHDPSNIELISILDCIQGICLIHYPSKLCCSDSLEIPTLLTYLVTKDENLLCSVLDTIEAMLIDSSQNQRIFEINAGVEIISNLLRQKKSERVMFKCIELIGVYLVDETLNPDMQVHFPTKEWKLSKLEQNLGKDFVTQLRI